MSAPGCRMHGSAPLLITAIAEHEAGINANRLNIYLPQMYAMTTRVSRRCLENYAIEVGCRIAHLEGCVDPTPL